MRRVLLTSAIVLAAGGVVASPPASTTVPVSNARLDASRFILDAVADGLNADGVPPALAAAIARNDKDFIPKCRICGMARKALVAHGELKQAPAAQAGRGLSEDLIRRLQSRESSIRHGALKDLIQRYMDHAHAKLDVSAEQRAALQKDLEEMRKMAMGGLPRGQKFCPSCDGACRIDRLRN
jgi:hypothetical protein